MKQSNKSIRLIVFLFFILSFSCKSQDGVKSKSDVINRLYISDIVKAMNYTGPRFEENVMGIYNIQTEDSLIHKFRNVHHYINSDVANVILDSISGYVTHSGELKLFPQFEFTYWFDSDFGYAAKKNKGAIINSQGHLLSDYSYDIITSYNEGFVRVTKDKNSNYLNKNGKPVFENSINLDNFFIIDGATIFIDSIGSKGNRRAKKGLIDTNNNILIPSTYNYISGFFSEGLMLAKKDDKAGFIDKKNKVVIPFEYDELKDEFSNGLVAAKKTGKWGFINKKNEIIIPFIYDSANSFSNGLSLVQLKGKLQFINTVGNTIIPNSPFILRNQSFAYGLCKINDKGKYGFMNKKGEIVIEAAYNRATHFVDGYAIVWKDGSSGVIDTKGDIVVPIKFKEVSFPINDLVYFVSH